MNFTVSVDGTEELKRAFTSVEKTVTNFRPVWKDVRAKFWEIEQDQFQSEGAKGRSGKWKDLSPAYEEIKVKKFGTFALLAGVLIATTDLYKSLTRQTDHTVYQESDTEMSVGTNLPYAKAHQYGRGNLPARPPIDLSDEQKKDVGKTIKKSLLPFIKKSGLKVTESNYKEI